MADKSTILTALNDSLNRSELPLTSSYAQDMSAAKSLLEQRAKRLAKSTADVKESEEVSYLFFDCAGQSFAIAPSSSGGFIPDASLYAIPTLVSKGISLVIFKGQQLPVFDMSLNRKIEGVISANLLFLGKEKTEFGIVVDGGVAIEPVLGQSFIECELDQESPFLSNVIAINSDGRMLIDIEKILENSYFDLAI